MKSALALDKDSCELFEAAEDDEEEGIDNGAEFDWETGDFDPELTEFEGDEEVRGRGGRRGTPGSPGRSRRFSGQSRSLRRPGSRGRPLRFSRPRRRRPPRRAIRGIFPGLAVRRRWTVGYPPEETLQGAEYVRWVQDSLNRVLALRLPVNGILGPETRSAVRRFQERERLPVTGIVGPDTERALIAALARVEPAGREEPALARVTPAGPAEPEPSEGELADLELETGADRSHPDYVRWIQQSLNRIMGLRLVADGRIGPETRSAIRSFQQRRGLRADAVVGAQTERALLAAGAGRPPQPRVRARVPRPAESDGCGVPPRTAQDEFELEVDIEELELETQNVTARPRLCFFQNHPISSHRKHFQCGAARQARRIGAIASPAVGACRRRAGSTPYNTGAEFITAIETARECLGRRAVDDIHIFSHSGSSGVYGTTAGSAGLYEDAYRWVDRSTGGRTVVDIPTAALANNVRFVLHGCNTAAGTDNVARSLYQHLAASLTNPRVYGHPNSGCAGRNSSWREYSNRHPTGRNLSSLPDIVSNQPSGGRRGCCGGT